jgi:hypothetical protein
VEEPLDGLCWICRRQAEAREKDLITPLLQHVKFRKTVDRCSRSCDELRIETAVIRALIYRLECRHYCIDHIEHQCCLCRASASTTPAKSS